MRILKIKAKNFEETVKETVKYIKKGKVVVCPTDTVYGLIADATNKKAVERIFKIKKRKKQKAIPIFVRNLKMAKRLAEINPKQEKFIKKSWPGKVTVVLKRKKIKTKLYGLGKETIALRIPKYKLINQLLSIINHSLSGTSANLSGKPAETEIKKVLAQFKNKKFQPDLILDAGDLNLSKPSTIIDLTGSKAKILRK